MGAVVRAAAQGLGVLAKSFYDAGLLHDVLVNPRRDADNHREWFADAGDFHPSKVGDFLDRLDVLLIFEKLHHWDLAREARRRGIRVVLMPMHELTPDPLPVEPDCILCPSLLELDRFRDTGRAVLLPVPVDVPWRERSRARVFVHNSGTAWGFFRNGTLQLLAALPEIRSPIRLIVRRQESYLATTEGKRRRCEVEAVLEGAMRDRRVEFVDGTVPYEDLWREGDAFVFPERYNGLSLPLQESRASGMLVIATDRYPINTWLPKAPLIPVQSYEPAADFGIEVESARLRPRDIAATIDRWYDQDISGYSREGRDWALAHSWSRWRGPYLDVLSGKALPDRP